jgi:hypothetical protein
MWFIRPSVLLLTAGMLGQKARPSFPVGIDFDVVPLQRRTLARAPLTFSIAVAPDAMMPGYLTLSEMRRRWTPRGSLAIDPSPR